jgi:Prp8 binding protein
MEGKEPVAEFDDGRDCPVTAVEWSKDGNQAFVGGVDNEVKVWDLRSGKVVYTLHGHTDTVSLHMLIDVIWVSMTRKIRI